MTSFTRSASGIVVGALATVLAAGAAHADPKADKRVQLPKQVLETDAPKNRGNSEEARARQEAEEAAAVEALERATSESSEGLVVRVLPNGAKSVDLEGRFQSVLVAVPTVNGGTATACLDGHDAAKAVDHVHAAPAAAPAPKNSKLEEM